ncbi:MAG: PEP-CTERM sorting domain-containing protein [Thermoguttaceae bacterium]
MKTFVTSLVWIALIATLSVSVQAEIYTYDDSQKSTFVTLWPMADYNFDAIDGLPGDPSMSQGFNVNIGSLNSHVGVGTIRDYFGFPPESNFTDIQIIDGYLFFTTSVPYVLFDFADAGEFTLASLFIHGLTGDQQLGGDYFRITAYTSDGDFKSIVQHASAEDPSMFFGFSSDDKFFTKLVIETLDSEGNIIFLNDSYKVEFLALNGPLPITTTPEPATLAMLGLGIVGLPFARKFRKNTK